MKILFITNLYPPHAIGGYEQVCRDMAEGLRNRGHDLWVLTSNYKLDSMQSDSARVDRLLRLQREFASRPPAALQSARDRLSAEWHNASTARQVLSQLDPNVVVFWNGRNLGRALISTVERLCPHVVFYLEDNWLGDFLVESIRRPSLRRRLKQATLRALGPKITPLQATRLIFCSAALKQEYYEMGVDVSDGRVIRNGVSTELFKRGTQRIIQRPRTSAFRILYAGRITPEKGVATLIRALSNVRQRAGHQDTTLNLVGFLQDDTFTGSLLKLIGELGLQGAVQFAGQRPRRDLPSIYEQHDVVVFPSEWREPFGLSLIEAMAVASPVVTTVVGGPGEIVRDRKNAVAFRAGDADDLADKLVWVLRHPTEAAAMGLRASRDVHQRFTLEAQLGALEHHLLSLAGNHLQSYREPVAEPEGSTAVSGTS